MYCDTTASRGIAREVTLLLNATLDEIQNNVSARGDTVEARVSERGLELLIGRDRIGMGRGSASKVLQRLPEAVWDKKILASCRSCCSIAALPPH
jgi:hypothetical protein